jgi:hypothetical protein
VRRSPAPRPSELPRLRTLPHRRPLERLDGLPSRPWKPASELKGGV